MTRYEYEELSKSYEIMKNAFEDYKKRVYFNTLPWYKKLWYKMTRKSF